MSILSDLQQIIEPFGVPVESGIFTGEAPETYIVIVPMYDEFPVIADNKPQIDTQEAMISIYSKKNYQTLKNHLISALIDNDMTITSRQYIGYETDTGYHHFNIDVAQYYEYKGDI